VSAAIVFAAVPLSPTPRLRARLAAVSDAFVIAADGGASTALAFGLSPDLVVGDFDSIDDATLARISHLPIDRHPRDKDATDGQLAIERALDRHPSHLYLLGYLGGPRLDQFVANVLLLTRLTVPTTVFDERNEAHLLRAGEVYTWSPEPTETVSLLPLSGNVTGVQTSGLRWRLNAETLDLGETRGVSNEPVAAEASVSIARGRLLLTRHFVD
jgi:thiamine pyrophosphokinase